MVDTLWRGNRRQMRDLKRWYGSDFQSLWAAASKRLEMEKLTDRFAPKAVINVSKGASGIDSLVQRR
jgi:hypothetical protein